MAGAAGAAGGAGGAGGASRAGGAGGNYVAPMQGPGAEKHNTNSQDNSRSNMSNL